MRTRRLILRAVPLVLVLALWVRSTCRIDFYVIRWGAVITDGGAVFLYWNDYDDGYRYWNQEPGSKGVQEENRGSVRRRWLPFWMWVDRGDRWVVVQMWAMVLAASAPVAWGLRRHLSSEGRGFEVAVPGAECQAPGDGPLRSRACSRSDLLAVRRGPS